LLQDRGYSDHDSQRLFDHISAQDTNGHITAKAIIGGNTSSLRCGFFETFEAQIPLHAAIINNANIACVDAARSYPKDHCLNYEEASTAKVISDIQARTGIEDQMGPDDMLIRNTHMARLIDANLNAGEVGVLLTGAAHVFGIEDNENGFHTYQDSLAPIYKELGISSVLLSMPEPAALPRDFTQQEGRQDLFIPPTPTTPTAEMSESDINMLFEENGLDPKIYDPRNFAEQYRVEFNQILSKAEQDLGIEGITKEVNSQTIPPNLITTPYCPAN
jgi:hypothetical protein